MKLLCIDIGGTFIKYASMQEDMTIFTRGKLPTPQESREALIQSIGEIYDRETGVDGIAVSMPGIIDSEKGYCAMGGALRYNDDFYFGEQLARRCPVPIHLENDAKCAAMAEAAAGSLKDVADGFVLIFGTMIGGGFIKNHRLHRGKHFSAGEVSYILTQPGEYSAPDIFWGNRCGVQRLCSSYAERKSLDPSGVDGILVFERVLQGEAEAIASLDEYTADIAAQIFNLQTILDPERFAIGGGISAQPVFLDYIRKNLGRIYEACPYPVPHAEVVACRFQNDANLYGALQCFCSAVLPLTGDSNPSSDSPAPSAGT